MKTMSMKELYYAAWYNLLKQWEDESKKNDLCIDDYGKESGIAKERMAKLGKQIDELHDLIIAEEKKENA